MQSHLLHSVARVCWKSAVVWLVASAFISLSHAAAAEAEKDPPKPKVALTLKADNPQPAGEPVVMEITLTNLGSKDIRWWCGGPSKYPKASDFTVEASFLGTRWPLNSEAFSNGQYEQGSGIFVHLTPGESIQVPLAVVVSVPENVKLPPGQKYFDHIHLYVSAVAWETDQSTDYIVNFNDRKETADQRRTQLIQSITSSGPPFWLHMAEKHADTFVIEALLKLLAIDVEPISTNARSALTWQPRLPESAGKDLAALVRKTCTPGKSCARDSPAADLIRAALKTQSEAARDAVFEYLKTADDPETCKTLYDRLRESPGDAAWFQRAQQAILEHDKTYPINAATSREAKQAVESLEYQIKHGQR